MVVLTGWLFASSCSPPRLSATQFLSATKGQLPLRSGLSPDCWSVLVGALATVSPPSTVAVAVSSPSTGARPWGHGRYSDWPADAAKVAHAFADRICSQLQFGKDPLETTRPSDNIERD